MPRRYQFRHPRSPVAWWARRLLGIAGTAVVLGAGVAAASWMLPDDDDDDAVVARPAPVSTAGLKQHDGRLTARERAQRRRAADAVRRQGYAPVKLADYRADHVLRVLIGKPVGATPAGLRAFFFVRDDYIGRDASSASLELRPGRQLEREIALVYTLFEEGDRACCPDGGDVRVHFRWTGEALEPQEEIPADFQRLPAGLAQ